MIDRLRSPSYGDRYKVVPGQVIYYSRQFSRAGMRKRKRLNNVLNLSITVNPLRQRYYILPLLCLRLCNADSHIALLMNGSKLFTTNLFLNSSKSNVSNSKVDLQGFYRKY